MRKNLSPNANGAGVRKLPNGTLTPECFLPRLINSHWALTVHSGWAGPQDFSPPDPLASHYELCVLGEKKPQPLMVLKKLSCPDLSSPDLLLDCLKVTQRYLENLLSFFSDRTWLSRSVVPWQTLNHTFGGQRLNSESFSLNFPVVKTLYSPSLCLSVPESCLTWERSHTWKCQRGKSINRFFKCFLY